MPTQQRPSAAEPSARHSSDGTPEAAVSPPDAGAWDSLADGYDRFTTTLNLGLGEKAVRHLGLTSQDRFLDVATGSGGLAIPAARSGARVTAVDFSARMIERLEARARAEGITTLEGRVMDGQDLALADDIFDASGSQFGVMVFPDLPRGLREMVRVTRPGGRVMMVVFGPASESEYFSFVVGALQAAVPDFPGLPEDPPLLPFQVADPQKLRKEMLDAGAGDVRVETIDYMVEFESGRHLWNVFTNSNPIGTHLVGDLPDDRKSATVEILDRMIRERRELREGQQGQQGQQGQEGQEGQEGQAGQESQERSGGGAAVLHNQIHIAVGTA